MCQHPDTLEWKWNRQLIRSIFSAGRLGVRLTSGHRACIIMCLKLRHLAILLTSSIFSLESLRKFRFYTSADVVCDINRNQHCCLLVILPLAPTEQDWNSNVQHPCHYSCIVVQTYMACMQKVLAGGVLYLDEYTVEQQPQYGSLTVIGEHPLKLDVILVSLWLQWHTIFVSICAVTNAQHK